MRFLLILIISIHVTLTYADTEVTTQIYDIDMGHLNEQPLIFLQTGLVVTIPKIEKILFERLRKAKLTKAWLQLSINKDRVITRIKKVSNPVMNQKRFKSFDTNTPYNPSILKDLDMAGQLFREARTDFREESQCFNRAHVWSYEWRISRNFYSSKAWLFFTRKFIRKYKFEWWFHVAPMVHVVTENQVKERVMDMKYAKSPLSLKQWTNIFLRDMTDCPVVEKYTDHANYPESGSCFLMKSSMYHYQPIDLERFELSGNDKSTWLESEVKHAFNEAFNIAL